MQKIFVFIVFCFLHTIHYAQGKYPSILWEVTKPGVAKPSYLFGTYHISNKGVFKLGDSIFYALKNVDIVAKEVNANTWQLDQEKMDKMETAYETFTAKLREVSFNENTLRKTNTIEKLPSFISYQPSFINYFLYRNNASKEGFEEEMYLDKFISSAGYKYGKEVKGLENYLESSLLGIEGQKDQADLEKVERKRLPDGMNYNEMQEKIYDGYLNNNLNPMDSFQIYEYTSDVYFNKFVVQRNYNQADSMDYYIRSGKSIFAAVGSAHLPGTQGVIEILRKKGYNVRPVNLKYTSSAELDAVKQKIMPLNVTNQFVDNAIQCKAPGPFYAYDKSDIYKTYGYVDMANSGYYFIMRLYNNAAYFVNKETTIALAMDSLLYGNIKGDIIFKKQIVVNGYTGMDVTAKVKNKDIERYRFIITPYEIIRFQVGGKNNYALSPFVDSFFATIKINQVTQLSNNNSFGFANKIPMHQWTNTSAGYLQNKQRFTNYDEINRQLNSCIKVVIPPGASLKDNILLHLIRESVFGAENFSKATLENVENFSLSQKEVKYFTLLNGYQIAIKTVLDFPHVYLLSSHANEKPNLEFINNFYLKENSYETTTIFVDSNRGFKVALPYALQFDAAWKKQMDRTKKEYEDIKNPNADKNLFYTPSNNGEKSVQERLVFEEPNNMEAVSIIHTTLDKELYYPNATNFWKPILKRFENSRTRSSSSFGLESSISAPVNYSSVRNYDYVPISYSLQNIKYDTSNNTIQKLSLTYYDSSSGRKTFYQYILSGTKLYRISFQQYKTQLSAFQQLVVNSFSPLETKLKIALYQNPLLGIINDYEKATKQKRPNVLSRLNNIHFGAKDIPQVDALYKSLSTNTIENNILKRKLIDMVSDGLYNDIEWITVSKWLQAIFTNTKELLTLRNFAATSIMDKQKLSDADWLLKNFYSTTNAFQKRFARNMLYYLRDVYPKKTILPKVKLVVNEKSDLDKVMLIDSSFYTNTERVIAFNFYKNLMEDETLNLQISQERNDFLFKEKEINENLNTDRGRTNFKPLLNGFKLFYGLYPKDVFFQNAFSKIITSKSNEDLIQLLEIMLNQKNYEADKISKIVEQLRTESNKLYDINKLFYDNNKYDKLDNTLKNVQVMAKQLLLEDRSSSKLDSLVQLGVKKYPYNETDSVYFFKYIKDRETNANVAYIILDKANKFLKEKPFLEFSAEQINAIESYTKVTDRLMRKYYANSYFYNRSSFYANSNYSKSLTSEE